MTTVNIHVRALDRANKTSAVVHAILEVRAISVRLEKSLWMWMGMGVYRVRPPVAIEYNQSIS